MHVFTANVDPVEITKGVSSRTLLESKKSTPEGVGVTHTILQPGSEIVFDKPMTEYLHYVIGGTIGYGGFNGDLLPSNTAIFVPCSKTGPEPYTSKHVIAQTGEAETRLLTIECKVAKPAFSWARRLDRNLYHIPQYHSGKQVTGQTKVLREEELMLMGSSRIHCVKVQSQATGTSIPVKTRPGSFVYTREGEEHGLNNKHERFPLQYVLVELVEHNMFQGGM
jgi:hypothetical protein